MTKFFDLIGGLLIDHYKTKWEHYRLLGGYWRDWYSLRENLDISTRYGYDKQIEVEECAKRIYDLMKDPCAFGGLEVNAKKIETQKDFIKTLAHFLTYDYDKKWYFSRDGGNECWPVWRELIETAGIERTTSHRKTIEKITILCRDTELQGKF